MRSVIRLGVFKFTSNELLLLLLSLQGDGENTRGAPGICR
jgi:hypothetical protein